MPRNFFLHETIDIIGQGQYDYMDTVAREPVHQMPGLFRLQGTFFVIGASGGRWPQVINLYDGGPDGWDAWTANLDRLNLKRRAKFYGDWWDEAAKYRPGGFDRISAMAPGCPTTAEIAERGIKGTVFAHQLLEVRPGTQIEYLAAVVEERVPLLAERGIHLTNLLEVINNPTEVVVVWATDIPTWVQLRKDFDTTRGLDDTGTPDPRLVEWQSVENRFVTGGRTELMTPRPGSVYGPESWEDEG
ncbi:MAG: hypothetical protein JRF61_12950 [Deltaproteobacteria bacterium]|jgi:hypothetical protein|nr:hypothetical protein [Deltaproteobacteria bacterium]